MRTTLFLLAACFVHCDGTPATDDAGSNSDAAIDATADAIADVSQDVKFVEAAPDTATDACPYCDDTKNCGSAGHDCLGGSCIDSVCYPVTLASGQSNATAIAISASTVYWTDDSGIFSCVKTGCSGVPTTEFTGLANTLALTSTSIYFSDEYNIKYCTLSSCKTAVTTLVSSQAPPFTMLGIDSQSVYWGTSNTLGNILHCALTGCSNTPSILFTDPYAGVVVSDGTNLYWFANGHLAKTTITNDGGAPQVLATGLNQMSGYVAMDSTNLYWANNGDGTVMQCARAGCGGSPTVLATGENLPFGVAVDGTDVYWVDRVSGTGTVQKCAIGGCGGKPTVIAHNQSAPNDIRVDATAIYWTNLGGSVMKLAK